MRVREDTGYAGASAQLPVDPFQAVGGAQPDAMGRREVEHRPARASPLRAASSNASLESPHPGLAQFYPAIGPHDTPAQIRPVGALAPLSARPQRCYQTRKRARRDACGTSPGRVLANRGRHPPSNQPVSGSNEMSRTAHRPRASVRRSVSRPHGAGPTGRRSGGAPQTPARCNRRSTSFALQGFRPFSTAASSDPFVRPGLSPAARFSPTDQWIRSRAVAIAPSTRLPSVLISREGTRTQSSNSPCSRAVQLAR